MSGPGLTTVSADQLSPAEARADVDARRVAQLLHVAAVGVFVADRGDRALRPVAASHPWARDLDTLQADLRTGPAYAAFRHNTVYSTAIDDSARVRWPQFSRAVELSPFAGASAVPVALHGRLTGVLMLYHQHAVQLRPDSKRYALAKILATVLVTAAVRENAMRDLQHTITELGTLLERVNRLTKDGGAPARASAGNRVAPSARLP